MLFGFHLITVYGGKVGHEMGQLAHDNYAQALWVIESSFPQPCEGGKDRCDIQYFYMREASNGDRKTTLLVQNMLIIPGPVYLVPVVGGGGGIFYFSPSPSLSLIQCTCSSPDYFMQVNSCLPSILPNHLITYEENSCYPNSL